MSEKSSVEKILEVLAAGAAEAGYLFLAIHEAGYGASQKAIEYKLSEIEDRSMHSLPPKLRGRKHSFYSMLSYLKRDGLIEKGRGKWSITKKGRKRLGVLTSRPSGAYKASGADTLKIVIFDVPEKERWKRDWIRESLTDLGFKLVQKSVWAGKKRIPKEFLQDLRKYSALDYVDIFAVTKSGSLRTLR